MARKRKEAPEAPRTDPVLARLGAALAELERTITGAQLLLGVPAPGTPGDCEAAR